VVLAQEIKNLLGLGGLVNAV
jgi:hypothetical protein